MTRPRSHRIARPTRVTSLRVKRAATAIKRFIALLIVVSVLSTGASLSFAADKLAVKDLIELKQIGFSEAEIRTEVTRTKSRFKLSDADIATLKKAGFTDATIGFLSQTDGGPPRPVATFGVDDVIKLVKGNKPIGEVLDAIAKAGKLKLSEADIQKLHDANLPLPVMAAMRGEALSVPDIRALATQAKMTPALWDKLVAMLGVKKETLGARDALGLVRAGVPKTIVTLIKTGKAATTAGNPLDSGNPLDNGNPLDTGKADPPPSGDDAGSILGIIGKKPEPKKKQPPVAAKTAATQPGVYVHPAKRFTVKFPKDWAIYRAATYGQLDTLTYSFSPEKNQSNPDLLKVAFRVQIVPIADTSTLKGKGAMDIFKKLMPLIRQEEPGLTAVGEVKPIKLGNMDAAHLRFDGTLSETPGDFSLDTYIAEKDGTVYFALGQAPRNSFAKYKSTFDKIVNDASFGRSPVERQDVSIEARHIVKKYKKSVVSVVATSDGDGGTGTGFIISKDGYILTNHHVIWNKKTNAPHKEFMIQWDEGMKRKPVPAKLLGYRRNQDRRFYEHWGADIALMKIEVPEGEDYEPFKLTPLNSVEAGDRVVTLGFPSRGLLQGVSITITTGVVTRFNRGQDGEINTIFTDAPITHGSSGGPCVSLVTGGVIGLNTFGMPVQTGEQGKDLNDLLNYFGVVPIDECLAAFPLVTDLGMDHEGKTLDAFTSYGLARLYAEEGSHEAALRLATRAYKLKPDWVDAHGLIAYSKLMGGVYDLQQFGAQAMLKQLPDITKAFNDTLAKDPKHEMSLGLLARLHLELGKHDEAMMYADRMAHANPDGWQANGLRADIALAKGDAAAAAQHAHKAAEKSGELFAEPYITLGKAYYAANDLEKGRAAYVKAAQIHPSNLDAQLGVVEYHDKKSAPDAAASGYQKLLSKFPGNPQILYRMGNSYFQAKRYKDALKHLEHAYVTYSRQRLPQPAELLMELAQAFEQEKNEKMALRMYAEFNAQFGQGDVGHMVHLKMANMLAKSGLHGLISAHLRRAQALGKSDNLTQILQNYQLSGMTVKDIKSMMTFKYPMSLMVDLIKATQMGFPVRSGEDLAALNRKEGIPAPLVYAIADSVKKNGTTTTVAQNNNGPNNNNVNNNNGPHNPPPPPPPPPNNPVLGTWVTEGFNPQGGRYMMVIVFAQQGQFQTQVYLNGQLAQQARGTYKVTQQGITATSNGQTTQYPYQVQGNVMVMQMPGIGNVRFMKRQ